MLFYFNFVFFVIELCFVEEFCEFGVEFFDEGLGIMGGRWIFWSELFILSVVFGLVFVLCVILFEKWCNLLLLFGWVDRLCEELDWDFCSSGGLLLWFMNFVKEKKVRERE